MKKKDLMTITTVALGTAALTVAAFLANPLEAGSEPNPPPAIATPRLMANGIELTLAPADQGDFKAGQQPAFALKAVNTLPTAADVSLRLTLSASAPGSRMSRIIMMPTMLWREEHSLTLGPRETKTITFNARTNLPANKDFDVSLAQVDKTAPTAAPSIFNPGIVALRFSTATPQPAGAIASSLAMRDLPVPLGPIQIPLTP